MSVDGILNVLAGNAMMLGLFWAYWRNKHHPEEWSPLLVALVIFIFIGTLGFVAYQK